MDDTDNTKDKRSRKREITKEQQADGVGTEENDNRPKGLETAESDSRPTRVTITIGFGDKRRHDIDGAAGTIIDCLVRARRRILDLFTK